MSTRASVLLISLLVIADGEALAVNGPLAVNAPLTIEPRSAEPREDLFSPKPRNALPNAAPAATPALTPPQAVPPAERISTGNPLWGIPLSRLIAIRERPLFAPTRQPPLAAVAAKPAPAAMAAPAQPVEPEKPQLSLLGTIAGRQKIGLFIDSATKSVVRLKAGETHKGWTLRDVQPRQVELARGLDSTVLDLPPPDMKAGAAPPLAMPAAASGMAALPVNTAKVTGTSPMPTPAAGATIVVQPPTIKPPPGMVNPFQKGRMP